MFDDWVKLLDRSEALFDNISLILVGFQEVEGWQSACFEDEEFVFKQAAAHQYNANLDELFHWTNSSVQLTESQNLALTLENTCKAKLGSYVSCLKVSTVHFYLFNPSSASEETGPVTSTSHAMAMKARQTNLHSAFPFCLSIRQCSEFPKPCDNLQQPRALRY